MILPLLSFGCRLTIANRTFSRAQELAHAFRHLGEISAAPMDQLDQQAFDLVINATASGISGEIPALPAGVVNVQTRCYDMFYQQGVTPFTAGRSSGGNRICRWAGYAGGAGGACFPALARSDARDRAGIAPAAQRAGGINPTPFSL